MTTAILKNAGNNRATLAYNTRKIPYDHGITNRVKFATMTAKKLSSKNLSSLQKAHVVSPLALSQEEQNVHDNIRAV